MVVRANVSRGPTWGSAYQGGPHQRHPACSMGANPSLLPGTLLAPNQAESPPRLLETTCPCNSPPDSGMFCGRLGMLRCDQQSFARNLVGSSYDDRSGLLYFFTQPPYKCIELDSFLRPRYRTYATKAPRQPCLPVSATRRPPSAWRYLRPRSGSGYEVVPTNEGSVSTGTRVVRRPQPGGTYYQSGQVPMDVSGTAVAARHR